MVIVAAKPRPHHRSRSAERELLLLACVTSVGLLAWFPILALAISATLLITLPHGTPRHVRLVLATVVALAMSLMSGARPIDPSGSNDIEGYYDVYQNLAAGDLNELMHFGAGLEVALPLLMLLFAWGLPSLSINGLMFCFALTSAVLLLIWVETTFYPEDGSMRPALMGISLLMLNLYFSTQLTRQFLSMIVLLFAFAATSRSRRALWLAIASAFHLTAIPFFGLYLLARRGWKGWLAILVVALLFRTYFWNLLVALDILPEAAAEKLIYYVDITDDSSSADIGSLRMLLLLAIICIAAVVAWRFRVPPTIRPWLAIPWITVAVHLLLLPIPLAALRTTLMIHSVVPGLLAYKIAASRRQALLPIVLCVLLVYKLVAIGFADGSANLWTTVAMLRSFLS